MPAELTIRVVWASGVEKNVTVKVDETPLVFVAPKTGSGATSMADVAGKARGGLYVPKRATLIESELQLWLRTTTREIADDGEVRAQCWDSDFGALATLLSRLDPPFEVVLQ